MLVITILYYNMIMISELLCIQIIVCHQYSKLVYSTIKNPLQEFSGQTEYITIKDCFDVRPLIAGGMTALPKEFPHMVNNNNIIVIFTREYININLVYYYYRLCLSSGVNRLRQSKRKK